MKEYGFVMLPSYYEALQGLDDDTRLLMYDTIFRYVFDDVDPDLPPLLYGYFALIKSSIDASVRRYKAAVENGRRGGRPKTQQETSKNQNETQQKPEQNPTETRPETQQKPEAKATLKPNENQDIYLDKDLDKDSDIVLGEVLGEVLDIRSKDLDIDSDKNLSKNNNNGRMKRPSVDEVREYCADKGYHIDPEMFVAYYESNGWKVGKNPMRDWRKALVTWEKRWQGNNQQQQSSPKIKWL